MKDVIVPLIAALIGAVTGAVSSVWVTRKQLSISFEKARLETLHAQLQKLEQLLSQLSTLMIQVKGSVTPEQLGSMAIDRFLRKASLVRPYYHYLSTDLCDEMSRLSSALSAFIAAAKMHKAIDNLEAREELEAMQNAEARLEEEITSHLRVWQAEISYLTSRK